MRANGLDCPPPSCQFLSRDEALSAEPALRLPEGGSAMVTPADAQISGYEANHAVLARCKESDRYCQMDSERVVDILYEEGGGGRHRATGVVTSRRTIKCNRAVREGRGGGVRGQAVGAE